MATADDVIAVAENYIGTTEEPPGSNQTIIGEKYGWNGVAWCCESCWVWFSEAGAGDLFYGGGQCAYVPDMVSFYQSQGRVFSYPERGNLACFDWDCDGVYDHIGIVTDIDGQTFGTIEGNTNDCCMRRRRTTGAGYDVVFIAPAYDGTGSAFSGVSNSGDSIGTVTRYLRYGCTGDDVKALQNALISRGFDCGGFGADGDFGTGTLASVRGYQSFVGAEVDGIVGQETTEALGGSWSAGSAGGSGSTFPLPDGHWFGTPKNDARNHSGYYDSSDRPAISSIQNVVGVSSDGMFGPDTCAAVTSWQIGHGLDADGEVGAITWGAMFG